MGKRTGIPARAWMVALASALILTGSVTVEAGVQLKGAVPETRVWIEGPVRLGGMTPLPLDRMPAGNYRLQAQAPGSAAARGRLTLDPSRGLRVGRLAGPRQLFLPPGLWHLQQGESSRGWLLLAGGAAGVTGALLKQAAWTDADDEATAARRRYEEAVGGKEFDDARLTLLAANDRKADEEDLRNLWGTYWGVVWVGAAVESWLLTPCPVVRSEGNDAYTLVLPRAGGWNAGLRSALVPGAGQRYLGRIGRGNRFTGGILALGAGAILAQDAFLEARRDQNDAQRRYEIAETEREAIRWRKETKSASDRATDWNRARWALVGATVGVYLWNVWDAATCGGEAAAPVTTTWQVVPERGGFRAGLTWRVS